MDFNNFTPTNVIIFISKIKNGSFFTDLKT